MDGILSNKIKNAKSIFCCKILLGILVESGVLAGSTSESKAIWNYLADFCTSEFKKISFIAILIDYSIKKENLQLQSGLYG